MQVDSKPFSPLVINMVNAQLRAEYREVHRPAKGKEPLAEPEPVPCSRCKYEIGQLRPPENKRKAAEPSQPTMKKFSGQYDRRPASRAVFDRLGAQSPSTSAGRKDEAAPRPVKTFKPPVVRDDRCRDKFSRPGLKRQKKMATANEPPSVPIVPSTTKAASIKPPRTWRPRQDGYPCRMAAVLVEPKAAALEKTDEGIIDVYHGRDPPFSANGLSFLMEFHKDHSTTELYGMTPENREIVELALKNAKAEALLITSGSNSAIKAIYQANRDARSDLEYLRQYFTVTPTDTIFGLTIEERARVSRLDDYLTARDALAKARQALKEEVEALDPP
ncbi:unnamed protein product [Prunus armeniaca]